MRRKIKEGTASFEDMEKVIGRGKGKRILDETREILYVLNTGFLNAGNQEARAITTSIGKDMVDMETGQRGFMITGKEEFLEPYHKGKEIFKKHIEQLNMIVNNAFDKQDMYDNTVLVEGLTKTWIEKAAIPEINIRKDINAGKERI